MMKEIIRKLSWKNLGWKGKLKVVLVTLFLLWLGVPTFNKWKADKLVDELCAKDGGVKVYETVTLPKERFNEWGYVSNPLVEYAKPEDKYYQNWETKDVVGKSDPFWALVIHQHHFFIYRTLDKKLLGEAITYARRGGDPWGLPIMPSSYSCFRGIGAELSKQVFRKADK